MAAACDKILSLGGRKDESMLPIFIRQALDWINNYRNNRQTQVADMAMKERENSMPLVRMSQPVDAGTIDAVKDLFGLKGRFLKPGKRERFRHFARPEGGDSAAM